MGENGWEWRDIRLLVYDVWKGSESFKAQYPAEFQTQQKSNKFKCIIVQMNLFKLYADIIIGGFWNQEGYSDPY